MRDDPFAIEERPDRSYRATRRLTDGEPTAYVSAGQLECGIGRDFVLDVCRAGGASEADLGFVPNDPARNRKQTNHTCWSDEAEVVVVDDDEGLPLINEMNVNSEDDMLEVIEARALENSMSDNTDHPTTPHRYNPGRDAKPLLTAYNELSDVRKAECAKSWAFLALLHGIHGLRADDIMADPKKAVRTMLSFKGQAAKDAVNELHESRRGKGRRIEHEEIAGCWEAFNAFYTKMKTVVFAAMKTKPFDPSRDLDRLGPQFCSLDGEQRATAIKAIAKMAGKENEQSKAMTEDPKAAIAAMLAQTGERAVGTIRCLKRVQRWTGREITNDEKRAAFADHNRLLNAIERAIKGAVCPLSDVEIEDLVAEVKAGQRDEQDVKDLLDTEGKWCVDVGYRPGDAFARYNAFSCAMREWKAAERRRGKPRQSRPIEVDENDMNAMLRKAGLLD